MGKYFIIRVKFLISRVIIDYIKICILIKKIAFLIKINFIILLIIYYRWLIWVNNKKYGLIMKNMNYRCNIWDKDEWKVMYKYP